jgi:hypothetical protein
MVVVVVVDEEKDRKQILCVVVGKRFVCCRRNCDAFKIQILERNNDIL